MAAKLVEPPPLPSAGAKTLDQQPAQAGGPLAHVPGEVSPPPVLWTADLITDLTDQLLAAAEEARVGAFLGKCHEAGLLPRLVKEIEADAQWPTAAKVLLKRSLPRLAVKWLNHFGISAEFQDELAVVTALILLVKHNSKLSKRLDDLIEANEKAKQPQTPAVNAAPQIAVLSQPVVLDAGAGKSDGGTAKAR